MATMAAAWTRSVLDYATAQGMERSRVLARAGLDEALLASPDFRVGRRQNMRMWRHIEEQLGDESLGLRMCQGLKTSSLGMLGFITQSCATVGESMELFVELYPLLRDWGRAELVHQGDRVALRSLAFVKGDGPWRRSLAEAAVAATVTVGQKWLRERYPLEAVHFQHARPQDVSLYEDIFGCPVLFGQPHNELIHRREALDMPLVQAQPELRDYLASTARSWLKELSPIHVVREVQEALNAALKEPEGDLGIEGVARRLYTSPRSLQRHLRQQGCTFQQLLDEARRHRAMEMLRQPGTTQSQVSEALGFSEPSAFRRALRRWLQQKDAGR